MNIVLDTNVLVSGVFWKGNESTVLASCLSKDISNFISPSIIDEFDRVLHYDKFQFNTVEIQHALETILACSTVILPQVKLDIVNDDSADNKILECAVAANAACIVSGDHHLLQLGSYKNINIVSAKQFIKLFLK
ncbi:MAG: putative toxin-antitoxin system toxin component, PIN family [Candidatus Thermoplasmatota archaeon]|nr:putative toxin-antitoxin system toxin component, PIN family [Candidatus Thermoplasmatota archaeon]